MNENDDIEILRHRIRLKKAYVELIKQEINRIEKEVAGMQAAVDKEN